MLRIQFYFDYCYGQQHAANGFSKFASSLSVHIYLQSLKWQTEDPVLYIHTFLNCYSRSSTRQLQYKVDADLYILK